MSRFFFNLMRGVRGLVDIFATFCESSYQHFTVANIHSRGISISRWVGGVWRRNSRLSARESFLRNTALAPEPGCVSFYLTYFFSTQVHPIQGLGATQGRLLLIEGCDMRLRGYARKLRLWLGLLLKLGSSAHFSILVWYKVSKWRGTCFPWRSSLFCSYRVTLFLVY